MKKKLFCIAILLVSILASAQTQETWPVETSEWYYQINPFIGCMPCIVQFQHVQIIGDTLILDKSCHIVEKNSPGPICDDMEKNREYLYYENQIVYWYNDHTDDFTILYDFSAEKDDTWEIKVKDCSFTVHVDSVSIMTTGASYGKVLHVSDERNYFTGSIIEQIGHTRSMFPKDIYYECDEIACDSDFIYGLQCYLENGELVYNSGTGFCDTLVGRQRYYPLLDENKVWNLYENWIWWGETHPHYLERCDIDTTRFIVKKEYHSQHIEELGYLFEDTASRKVYYTNMYGEDEVLLYDFNLVEGDVFQGMLYNVVISVDSIQLLDGTFRRRIMFDDGGYFYWIEGIGSHHGGLLWNKWHFKKHIPEAWMLCYYENDSLLYIFDLFDTCNYSWTDVNVEINKSSFIPKIYPNPFSQNLSLSFGKPVYGEKIEISVMALDGRVVYIETINSDISLDLSFLNMGIYLLVIEYNNGDRIISKIAKTNR